MNMENDNYEKLEIECEKCKAEFDVWVQSEYCDSDMEENVRKHLYNYCPVCKALAEIKEKQKLKAK